MKTSQAIWWCGRWARRAGIARDASPFDASQYDVYWMRGWMFENNELAARSPEKKLKDAAADLKRTDIQLVGRLECGDTWLSEP